jgi:two-component system cell cycle sensor histidine kinase/response regulator CckA
MNYEKKTKDELISELKSLKSKVEGFEDKQSEEARKTPENTLQESRDKYQRLIENLQDNYLFYSHNTDGIFTFISPSLTNILGYSVEEFLTHYSEYLTDNPINKKVVGHTELSIKGIKQPPYEVEIYHKDGTIRLLHVQEVPVFNNNRKVIAVEGIAKDITEHHKMEKELIKAQKLESIGVFAGGIAHDFNNYLQTILGYISLAKIHTKPNDEIYGFLEEAGKAVIQSRDLTNQLLTFSKGRTTVKTTISISELLESSAKLPLSGSNVKCELVVPEGLWNIEADKGQLNQVISNLIINADQAMPKGGDIKIRAENINLDEKNSLPLQEGRYVKITVKDHGTGILQEHLQKVFDPYFTTKKKGNGLGLATAYSIIKKHGGYITVESEVGACTTFHIYFPASKKELPKESVTGKVGEPANKHREKMDAEKPAAIKGRILVMDDEYAIRTILCKHIRFLNYEVEAAGEGSEAISLYKNASGTGKPFDAVIMDLTIPGGMGGEETIKKLFEIDPDVRAIVSSGYANNPILANYMEYGFKGVLAKPHEIHELDEGLQKVLAKVN